MQITWERITFPFREEKWLGNMAVAGLFGLIGLIFFPAYIVFAGQMTRLMKQTMRGEEPTLTNWDDFGQILVEGLKVVVVPLRAWAGPRTRTGPPGVPRTYDWVQTFPSRTDSTVSDSESALTTLTPTPCRPPETL